MRKVIALAIREYVASVKTKGFIIGLVLAPLMMGGSILAFALLKDRVDTTDRTMAIIDHSGVMEAYLIEAAENYNENEILDEETGKKIKPAYYFEGIAPTENMPDLRLQLSDQIRDGELFAFLEIGAEVVHPGEDEELKRIHYHAKNAAMDDLRSWLNWPINNQLRRLRLEDAGIQESGIPDLFYWVNVDGLGLITVDDSGDIEDAKRASEIEALLVPIIIMMLMFMMIMMTVPGMLQSVMEEKTQRIAEVLLGSIKPFQFMLGKLLGGLAVSFTSISVYLVAGIGTVRYMGFSEYFPFHILPWFVTYMLLAVIMFGAMSASLGATCSEAKDAQSLSFPAMLPVFFPMFIYFFVAKEPLSTFATVCSLIPPFTPLLMLLRQATPEQIPLWQPIAGLIGVLAYTILSVWMGGRLFRVAILMQGTPPKLSNILRWAIKG